MELYEEKIFSKEEIDAYIKEEGAKVQSDVKKFLAEEIT